ncbi:MAG: hypothetical protein QME66_12890 [Candidatus Eisenbacteria bacterium]|nr:hypothetical protein [Candidatus Eisenbacteria bacterium]
MSNTRPMTLLIVTTVLAVILAGCSPGTQEAERTVKGTIDLQPAEETAVVSQQELASARGILMRHLEALSSGDTRVLLETSPEYRHYVFRQPSWPDQARSWAQLKVVTLETPGEYLDDEAMRRVCREALGRAPYQVAVFHVVADRPFATTDDQEMDLDVVMIRPSPDSGWLVHDMGR